MLNTQSIAAPTVSVIPATKRSVQNGGQLKEQKEVRVAAYCRVSTGDESQKTSYTEQNKFYTDLIDRTEGWTKAGVYADEAITGTSRIRRKEFNRMMGDALDGKIDYIITKSISRFARNTVDTLSCIRELRSQDPPVGVYFEKEHIDTLDAKGELILTILSALAQDESRSISDNIRWSFQKRFQAGRPHVNLQRMIGYEKGPDGEWVIVPEQAQTVRFIFEQFLLGKSANSIAKALNGQGKRSVNGKLWTHCTVYHVLKNEKFVGDCEMQKYVTKDFLTHYSTQNMGEAPRYYVKDHHVGIIDRDTWDRTQMILNERGNRTSRKKAAADGRSLPNKSPFGNLFCGTIRDGKPCGAPYYRADYQAAAKNYTDERSCAGEAGFRDKYRFTYIIWRCSSKRGKAPDGTDNVLGSRYELKVQDDGRCPSSGVYEVAVEQSFMEMLYRLKRDYDANGDNSWLMRQYAQAYNAAYKRSKGGGYSAERMALLNDRIRDLEENLRKTTSRQMEAMRSAAIEQSVELRQALDAGEVTLDEIEVDIRKGIRGGDMRQPVWSGGQEEAEVYANLARDISKRLEECRAEKASLEAELGSTATMRKNFDFFLRCLAELPETNPDGGKINVNGLDTEGTFLRTADGQARPYVRGNISSGKSHITPEKVQAAPDFLKFERGIYVAFIEKGFVGDDSIEFQTNFGVKFTCCGTGRTLAAFQGYRRYREDGTVEVLLENWQVNDKPVNHSKVPVGNGKTGRRKKDTAAVGPMAVQEDAKEK